MRNLRHTAFTLLTLTLLNVTVLRRASAQAPVADLDSDSDGISDSVEQALLLQFVPTFMVARHDCSKLPAEFQINLLTPTVKADDGVIYGQVFPAKSASGGLPAAEIHFYHLWRSDCGPHGHPLDAEHVAVLVTGSDRDPGTAKWKAVYWYAAAHEKTVCDVSQIARASTLHAEEGGARVFISPGKHASYFNEALCKAGCGADKCANMVEFPYSRIINLGEAGHPMNGAVFIASRQWPLVDKMSNTDFPSEPLARLNQLPDTDIAWFKPGRHPAQGIISNSNATRQALAVSADNTAASLSTASRSTDSALSAAQDGTGKALQKTVKKTGHALATSAKHVGKALSPPPKPEKTK